MVCAECREDKSIEEFYVDRSRPRGHVARCKVCYSRKQHLMRAFDVARRYREVRDNAQRREIQWSLEFHDYLLLFWDVACAFCGLPNNGGVDRVNNEKFYDLTNTLACCGECNRMKGKMTLHDFIAVVGRLADNLGMTANAAVACGGK